MFGIQGGLLPVVPRKTRAPYGSEVAYSPDQPGEMLTSLQEIVGKAQGKQTMDTLELSRDDISQLTNKSEATIRRSGYLGEDAKNPIKGGMDRGPNYPMFRFFLEQFDEIAPVDGNPDSISPADLVQPHPELARKGFWERNPRQVGNEVWDTAELVNVFQKLLTRAGKKNAELTCKNLLDAREPSRFLLTSKAVGEDAKFRYYADLFRKEFSTVAPIDGDPNTISIYDLVIRNRECPEVENPTYPFRKKIKGRTGPQPGY